MKTLTLKQFKDLLLNNKVHFLGSLGFNNNIEKATAIIDKNLDNGFKFMFNDTVEGKNNILYRKYEGGRSRIDLNGKVYNHNGVYILHGNDNSIMLYAVENN